MWKAERPTHSADSILKRCADGIGDAALRKRVCSAVNASIVNHRHYEMHLDSGNLADVQRGLVSLGTLNDAEAIGLYSDYFVPSGKGARDIYLEIRSSAPLKRCPYCRHGQTLTVDHFVPKSVEPRLSVEPLNLIAACSDCNKAILDSFDADRLRQFFHPYSRPFPVDDNLRWLYAELIQGSESVMVFEADPGRGGFTAEVSARIVNQFEKFRLGALYSNICVSDIVDQAYNIKKTFDRVAFITPGDRRRVIREHLREAALRELELRLNGYRGATFEALAESDWFIDEGYKHFSAML